MKTKNIIWIIALILVITVIGTLSYGYYRKVTVDLKNPIATMEVENFGTIKIELYPEIAPQTVANFITLANRGFYDGLTFHRVVKDFMIQGGDKNGDGTGSATIKDLKDNGEETAYTIKGEFIANGEKENKLRFEEGVVGMARSDYTAYSSTLAEESYNSGSSQFFIMTEANSNLDGYYTSFGKVTEGMDIVHKIEDVELKKEETTAEDGTTTTTEQTSETPVNPPKITSIKVETYGIDYGLPETLEPFDYMSWLYAQYGINPDTLGE